MIKHLVFFKLAEEADGNSKPENILIIKERLESLREMIPVIRKMEVFPNHFQASSENYDIVLDSEFDSLQDLKAYAVHPGHLKVREFIAKVSIGRAAIDYEF
ncbi:Dabb family protein [uncultured Proteiniphilum sp.]|uniref:Dabb family protein n=1 Tax=uncultured Proteiniphilum sp. TaxID=497637 RepID=UPI00262E0277|nr:Dabb family protein [uncultured Proteiniphilum sp.]